MGGSRRILDSNSRLRGEREYTYCLLGNGRSGGGVLGGGFFVSCSLQAFSGFVRSNLLTTFESDSGPVAQLKSIKRGVCQNLPFWVEMQWGGVIFG